MRSNSLADSERWLPWICFFTGVEKLIFESSLHLSLARLSSVPDKLSFELIFWIGLECKLTNDLKLSFEPELILWIVISKFILFFVSMSDFLGKSMWSTLIS